MSGHLALHDATAQEARRHGARAVRVVAPALARPRPTVTTARRAAARAVVGLPQSRPLVLVTGGAEGIGALARAADDILATGLATPVVLCGRNTRLLQALTERGVPALGWVSDMPTLYAAVDAVVQNAGGSISLEALTQGLPVVSYRCLPGHGESNAAALERAGLAPWARDTGALHAALTDALALGRRDHRSDSTQLTEGPCVGAVLAESVSGALPRRLPTPAAA